MLQLTIKQGGKSETLDFPESAHEVTLNAFIDYERATAALTQWRKVNDDANFNDHARYRSQELRLVIACIAAFLGKDVSETPFGGFRFSKKTEVAEDVETTVFTVLNLCTLAINSYQYRDYTDHYWFTYKGKKYVLPRHYVDGITHQSRFGDLTCAQVVESYEAVRLFQTVQAQDTDGGYLFKTILNLIACLAQEDGFSTKFPTSESEIQAFVSEQILYFSEIDMQTALDVYNFFFGTIKPFAPTRDTSGSSSHRKGRNRKAKRRPSGGENGKQKTTPFSAESGTGTSTTGSLSPASLMGTQLHRMTVCMQSLLSGHWRFSQIKMQGHET